MSMRPIDFQVSVTRGTENARILNNDNGRPDVLQQVFSKEFDKQVVLESKQVTGTNKSDFNKVNEDGRRKNSKEKGKKKDEENKTKKQADAKKDNTSTSMYDISI